MQEAHEHDIFHRDIKSENIMVTPKGQVKVMDFGLAKLKGTGGLTKAGTTKGTISYMSPEQARGEEVDHRTDIWSFGVVLYEMITGLRSGVPLKLERIVDKALKKNPENHFQSAKEIWVDFNNINRESEIPQKMRSMERLTKS